MQGQFSFAREGRRTVPLFQIDRRFFLTIKYGDWLETQRGLWPQPKFGEERAACPKGAMSRSPGLARFAPTLGNDQSNQQPQRGCVTLPRVPRMDTTPLGLPRFFDLSQGSAGGRNPGLEDTIPSGFFLGAKSCSKNKIFQVCSTKEQRVKE